MNTIVPILNFTSTTQAEEALLDAIDDKESCWQEVMRADERMRLALEYLESMLTRYREKSKSLTTVMAAVAWFTTTDAQMPANEA